MKFDWYNMKCTIEIATFIGTASLGMYSLRKTFQNHEIRLEQGKQEQERTMTKMRYEHDLKLAEARRPYVIKKQEPKHDRVFDDW
jgi:hypothetical protein